MSQGRSCRPGPVPRRQVEDGYTLLTWNGLGFDLDILAEESQLLPNAAPWHSPTWT